MSFIPLKSKSLWRGAAITSIVSACISMVANGQTERSGDDVGRASAWFLKREFAQCAGTYYLGSLDLPVLMCAVGAKKCQAVIEYKDAQFKPVEHPLTVADGLNGIKWKGHVRMDFSASRARHITDGVWGAWEEWLDGHREQDVFDMRYKGQWSGEVGPDLFKLPISIDQYLEETPSCTDILDSTPHKQREPATFSIHDPPLGKLNDRSYVGTPDGFAAALPGFVQRAAVQMEFGHMDLVGRDFGNETAQIISAVRTCAQVTPQMYSSLMTPGARVDLSKLGEQYKICAGSQLISNGAKPVSGEPERGITLTVGHVGNNGNTEDDQGFHVEVLFAHLDSDPQYVPISPAERFRTGRMSEFDAYGIVGATIFPSGAVKRPVSSEHLLQGTPNRLYTGTATEFATAFAGFIEQAARSISLDPSNYQKETTFIIEAVKTCAGITPQMIQRTAQRYPNGKYGPPNMSKLGNQYNVCYYLPQDVSVRVKNYNKDVERGLMMWMTPRGGEWGSGQGINVQVFFTKLKGESISFDSSHFNALGVVSATIH